MMAYGHHFDLRADRHVLVGGLQLHDTVVVAGGRWLFQGGAQTFEGGFGANPYPLDRFNMLVEAGALDVLLRELSAPTPTVSQVSDTVSDNPSEGGE
jgi:hypothetical protein